MNIWQTIKAFFTADRPKAPLTPQEAFDEGWDVAGAGFGFGDLVSRPGVYVGRRPYFVLAMRYDDPSSSGYITRWLGEDVAYYDKSLGMCVKTAITRDSPLTPTQVNAGDYVVKVHKDCAPVVMSRAAFESEYVLRDLRGSQ